MELKGMITWKFKDPMALVGMDTNIRVTRSILQRIFLN